MRTASRAVLSFKLSVEHQKALIYSILPKKFGDDKQRWIRALKNAIPEFEKEGAKVEAVAATEVLKELERSDR